ncbi:MAG: hypothetical protein MUD01_23050 [Chloroflexaceae bacterium]|jgi:tetratricopeptide (TPR) repeat protein|nr:hypothetical protein [Chloroflexaceae bacterium]
MVEQVRANQHASVEALLTHRNQGVPQQDQADLDGAIAQLQAALNPANWRDATSLNPEQTTTVFAHYQAALTHLERLVSRDPENDTAWLARQTITSGILDVVADLAVLQLGKTATDKSMTLAMAHPRLAEAQNLRIQGNYQAVLQVYAQIWRDQGLRIQ